MPKKKLNKIMPDKEKSDMDSFREYLNKAKGPMMKAKEPMKPIKPMDGPEFRHYEMKKPMDGPEFRHYEMMPQFKSLPYKTAKKK
jgi:hypothetical protein